MSRAPEVLFAPPQLFTRYYTTAARGFWIESKQNYYGGYPKRLGASRRNLLGGQNKALFRRQGESADNGEPGRCRSASSRLRVIAHCGDASEQLYSQIRSDLRRTGELIGPNELMMAAITLAHNLTVVTHNTKECAAFLDSGSRTER
jgi:hypothetical protein